MMRFLLLLAAAYIAFVNPTLAKDKESTFDRILRTGTIRCGYYVFPPMTYKDPNTGKMSGISVDTMNYIADRASLKVEWTEEVTFGNWVPVLQSNRVDVICTPMWPELPMARVSSFTTPMFFSGLYPVVRIDDTRFDNITDRERFNQPDVTVVSQEGNITSILAHATFPNAKHLVLSPESDTMALVMSVVNKKADMQQADLNAVKQWNDNNEDKIKIITSVPPIKVQQFPMALHRGDDALLNFLNLAIEEMHYNGEMDRILRKWEPEPGKTYLRVAKPYTAMP